MITAYFVKKIAEDNPDKYWYRIDGNNVIDKESNQVVGSLDTFVSLLRKKMHCDFDVIFYCHVSLVTIYQCKECGTVIFSRDDEEYDPNLRCPTCGEYKTHFEYWTAEDIANDEDKQNTIETYKQMQQDRIEADKRYVKRGNKYDWQIWHERIKLPKRAIILDLECDNLFKTKLKGLRLDVHWAYKDGISYIYKKHFTIPLSWSALKMQVRIRKKRKEIEE